MGLVVLAGVVVLADIRVCIIGLDYGFVVEFASVYLICEIEQQITRVANVALLIIVETISTMGVHTRSQNVGS